MCCDEAAADIVILYARADDRPQMGALIEAGAALGAGKQVWCISPHNWSWRHHPNVENFDSLAAAITALRAMQAGKAARVKRVAA
jgi:hypothetical protein